MDCRHNQAGEESLAPSDEGWTVQTLILLRRHLGRGIPGNLARAKPQLLQPFSNHLIAVLSLLPNTAGKRPALLHAQTGIKNLAGLILHTRFLSADAILTAVYDNGLPRDECGIIAR
jgi:hypothetical protein